MGRMDRSKLKRFFGFTLIFFIIFATFLTASVEYALSETPRYGGVLKVIYPMSPRSLGWPSAGTGPGTMEALPCIEALVTLDKAGMPKPCLATDWQYSADFKSLTLSLRKGVKFHDGSDFNAKVVKANLEERKANMRGSELRMVESVDVIDNNTIRLNLKAYDNTLLGSFAFYNGFMISPKAIKKGKKWAMNNPVGTGPFQFVSYQRNVALIYKRFDGYWDKGKPYLDGLEVHFITDRMTGLTSFEAGEAQVLRWLKPENALALKQKGYNVIDYTASLVALAPDSANPKSIFADKRIMEAIEYAINKKPIIDALGHGYWYAANQFSAKVCNGYNPDYQGRPYDPDKAKQLLADAGYSKGLSLKIIACILFVKRDLMAAVQNDLKKVGINVELEFIDMGKYFQLRNRGWKDALFGFALATSKNFTADLARTFRSKTPVLPSLLRSPELDDVLNKALTATDYATQTKLTQKAVRIISDSAMVIPLYYTNSITAMHKSVRDTGFGEGSYRLWTPSKVWLSE